MPKQLRLILPETTYHCYSRCHGLLKLLLHQDAKTALVDAIKMCQEKYKFELIAAEIVDNHFHFVIRTLKDGAPIDCIMQYIKARTAEKYNKATGRKGAFWNERYKCKIVEHSTNPQRYLRQLLWYIAYNPVKKGLSRNPRNNYIGFIRCYLRRNYQLSTIKITLHHFFYELGNSFVERVRKFLSYEKEYVQRRLVVYS